jgi:Ca2+-binding EF-hand superfamily protein
MSLSESLQDIDADGSGTISRAELLAYLDIPSRRYFHRVFEMFDEDQSGTVRLI